MSGTLNDLVQHIQVIDKILIIRVKGENSRIFLSGQEIINYIKSRQTPL